MIAPYIEPAKLREDAHIQRRMPHVKLPGLTDHAVADLRLDELRRAEAKLAASLRRHCPPQS